MKHLRQVRSLAIQPMRPNTYGPMWFQRKQKRDMCNARTILHIRTYLPKTKRPHFHSSADRPLRQHKNDFGYSVEQRRIPRDGCVISCDYFCTADRSAWMKLLIEEIDVLNRQFGNECTILKKSQLTRYWRFSRVRYAVRLLCYRFSLWIASDSSGVECDSSRQLNW